MRRLSRVGFVAACAGLVLCALGLGAAVVDYTAPPWRWSGAGSGWLLVSGAFCLLGFFVTATGGALSLASFLRSRKQGEPHPNASARRWTAAFGVAALLCIAFSFWLAVSAQSAYQRYVHPLALAEENRLDSLSPDAVARTYIETHSASLEYWLSDANQRSDWRADNVKWNFSNLAGVSGLELAPLKYGGDWDNDTRTFRATYRTRLGNRPYTRIIAVSRLYDSAPWQISYFGSP